VILCFRIVSFTQMYIMERLKELSGRRINHVSMDFHRYLMNEIHWDERIIGISGARGSGKTTFLLQRAKILSEEGKHVLYVSVDDFYFSANRLVLFAEEFAKYGGVCLFLDEVHKYPNWSQELKNIYDSLPELNVVFTSSSALELYKGKYDLSRRAVMYDMQGLSFREYLELKHRILIPVYPLTEILKKPADITASIIRVLRPLPVFEEYLREGIYPFFMEQSLSYTEKLLSITALVIETDLPSVFHVDYQAVIKLKRLLSLINSLVPYTPNVEKLARQTGVTRDTLLRYLYFLERSHLVLWLSRDPTGINYMNKPDKLYLHNTNLSFAFNPTQANRGNIRETSFLNQLAVRHTVNLPVQGDFFVDQKWTFEIGGKSKGGKSKGGKQIRDIRDSYVVRDAIEVAYDNVIPLWLFGFLY